MHRTLSLLVAGAAALALAAPASALDVDLVVQMPLAVVEVEDAGYPSDDLALLTSSLIAAELEPVEVIDTLRWAPVVWLLDELADDADLFLDADLDLDPEVRRLRLIEDRDGRFVLTTREDLVFVDLADPVAVERQFLVNRDRDVIFDGRVRDGDRDVVRERDAVVLDRDRERLDDRGLGAYVQFLLDQGLRGRELADAIHAELNRRGVPAGPKDRLDGPPPVSGRFVAAQLPERVIVDGREAVLLDDDVDGAGVRAVPRPDRVKRRLAEAPPMERRSDRVAGLGRPDDDDSRGRGKGRSGPPADRGRGADRDDRGGGPPDHAQNRGRGGDDRGGPPAARGNRGGDDGPPAARGNSGRGGGNPKADRGNSGRGGGGKPKADRGNSGGGKGKAAGGNGGGGNRGQGGGGKGGGKGRG